MIDFQVAYDKLAGLETSEDIADLFKGYGVQAVKGRSDMCAISAWLMDQTGLDIMTNYGGVYIINVDGNTIVNVIDKRENTPAMRKFVGEFDLGYYPDLEKAI